MKRELSQLREALLDINGILNRPQPDAALIATAGVDLDRALFPVLVRVERRGPLGIVELAELCGRDFYTTVSRQVAKLESLGLVGRQVNAQDARVKEAVITEQGRTRWRAALDGAREKIFTSVLADWRPARTSPKNWRGCCASWRTAGWRSCKPSARRVRRRSRAHAMSKPGDAASSARPPGRCRGAALGAVPHQECAGDRLYAGISDRPRRPLRGPRRRPRRPFHARLRAGAHRRGVGAALRVRRR